MELNDHILFIRAVYKDVVSIPIEATDNIRMLHERFYAVMERHGICQGTITEGGRSVANAEWVLFFQAFRGLVDLRFNFESLINNPPNHLLAYDEPQQHENKSIN